jgi:transposase
LQIGYAIDSMAARGSVAMSDLIWLSEAQMRRIEPHFPLSHGIPRVDSRQTISGIVFVIRNGLRWRDAPAAYGPHKTICNRWSRMGVFNKIFAALAGKAGEPDTIMIDAAHLKAHRTAASLLKGGASQTYRAHQRRAEPQASCRVRRRGADERPQGCEALLFASLPDAKVLLGDKGHDSDWLRAALAERGTDACIPPLRHRKVQHAYDKQLYRQVPQDRKRLCQDQGLAPHRNPLRPMCAHLHLRNLHRRNCLLLLVANES